MRRLSLCGPHNVLQRILMERLSDPPKLPFPDEASLNAAKEKLQEKMEGLARVVHYRERI